MRAPAVPALLLGCLLAAPAPARQAPLYIYIPPPAELPLHEPPPAGIEPEPAPLDLRPRFLEGAEPDDAVLSRLCDLPLRSILPLGGGASISLKGVLEGGHPVAVKPDQSHVTRYYAEVAAYRVSRALGLGKVAPSCVRRFPREVIFHAGMPKSLLSRMEAEVHVDKAGQVACAVIQWVPKLRSLGLEKVGWWQPLLRRGAPWPRDPQRRRRLLDISTLLLLDYLIENDDRWSGGNTHLSGDRMVFLDQGAGFGRDSRGRRSFAFSQLRWSQRFDRDVADALFRLDLLALARDLQPLLTEREIGDLRERIEEARRYLRRLKEQAPEDSLL